MRLSLACLALAGLFLAYHFVLRWVMLEMGLPLGAVRPGRTVYRIVPLYIYWHPNVKLMLLAGVGAAFLFWFGRVAWPRRRSPLAIMAALMAWPWPRQLRCCSTPACTPGRATIRLRSYTSKSGIDF
ncbi:MAG TPA: hypothetical protein VMV10_10540 [Pirellulales bacterium]|nr:hypothetical protein [Pirellulales bacterium]